MKNRTPIIGSVVLLILTLTLCFAYALELNVSLDGGSVSNSLQINYFEGKQKVGLISNDINTDILPAMTSNSTPFPFVVNATSCLVEPDYSPYKAFDDSADGKWVSVGAPTFPQWIKIDIGASYTVIKYTITSNLAADSPKDWEYQGSNNNSSWTTLNIQNNISFAAAEKKTYTFSNPTAYRYYRLLVVNFNGGFQLQIVEMEFMIGYSTAGETVTLASLNTGSTQTMMYNQILFPSDTLITNSDIQVSMNLDNGGWSSYFNVAGLNGTTPDAVNKLYYPLTGNLSNIAQTWQFIIKLNSNATIYQEVGRPILGNYIAPIDGGATNACGNNVGTIITGACANNVGTSRIGY